MINQRIKLLNIILNLDDYTGDTDELIDAIIQKATPNGDLKRLENLKISFKFNQESDYISLCLEHLTISFDLDEIYGHDVVEDDFNFKANVNARLQVFGNTYSEGLNILFKLIKELVCNTKYDILLLYLKRPQITYKNRREGPDATRADINQ